MPAEVRNDLRHSAPAGEWGNPLTMLLVEPDEELGRRLVEPARQRGLHIVWSRDGGDALVRAGAARPDLVIVAAQLPTVDSSAVIRTIKHQWKMCILVGAAPAEEALARAALAAGAHAAVARPYNLDALLRIGLGVQPIDQAGLDTTGVLSAGPMIVDVGRHEVWLDTREVPLTVRELQLLAYLIRRRGQVADRHAISLAVWGHEVDTNTVAVHIKRLRDKLGRHPVYGQLITTIRGAGYRLSPSIYADPPSAAS